MKFKPDLKIILATFLMALVILPVMAQERQVTGTVYEPDGVTPIFGATVVLKGTSTGTSTDSRGVYSIRVAGTNPVLEYQFLGYVKQEIAVGDRNSINVTLQEEAIEVSAVVVTALGLTREEKSLGYSVSKVGSEELTNVVATNWLSGMAGKVAGLTFNSASTGPISSMRVTLRGDASLKYGSNEALFVVDGVPVRSGTTATSSSSSYTNSGSDFPVDYGNGASDFNPEDIESVSVLKGPAATALYGSRAANGAVIITTKSGRKSKGIGVTLNSSVVMERAGYWPDFQTQFGSGSDMGLNEYNFWTLDPSLVGTTDYPPRNLSRYAWGEEFSEDKLRYQYEGKNWETGEIVKTPFVYKDDWFTGIFQDGVTLNNSLAISGSNGEGQNIRFSVTDTRNKWILPNTGYQKQAYAFSFETPVNK